MKNKLLILGLVLLMVLLVGCQEEIDMTEEKYSIIVENNCIPKADPIEIEITLPPGEEGVLAFYVEEFGHDWHWLVKTYCRVEGLKKSSIEINLAMTKKLYGMTDQCEMWYNECIPEYEGDKITRIICEDRLDSSRCVDKTYKIKFY